ncbi:MAG: hypothetical protein Q9223_000089 [Gallowayella weberi]
MPSDLQKTAIVIQSIYSPSTKRLRVCGPATYAATVVRKATYGCSVVMSAVIKKSTDGLMLGVSATLRERIHKISGNDRGQARKKRKLGSQSTYKEEEKKWVVHYLKVEVARRNLTESKWENISKGLARHGFDRSKCSIKAWWSRYGREETGFDERQNPTGRNMVTSKQNPEDRKQARHLRKTKRRAEETKLKQDHVTEEKAGMNQGSLLSQGQEHESVYQEAEKSMIPSSLRGLNRSESGSNLRTE